MVNKKIGLGILAMMLVFGMVVVENLEAQTDTRLNGTWVIDDFDDGYTLTFNNGNYEGLNEDRGTYTTRDGIITFNPTHFNGDYLNEYCRDLGINFVLESKWYSVNELRRLRPPRELEELISSLQESLNYSIRGGLFILTTKDGETTTYRKQ